MPDYVQGQLTGLQPGDQQAVYNAESLTTGHASRAVVLVPDRGGDDGAAALSFEVGFSGAPGAFTLQPQVADTDVDAAYIAVGSTITTVNAGNYARQELNTNARFARVFVTLQPANAVTATVKITR
jgi:hypothetical protein